MKITLQMAKINFDEAYKKEWRESENPKRQKAINGFWNAYIDQLLVDGMINEHTAKHWYNGYYTV